MFPLDFPQQVIEMFLHVEALDQNFNLAVLLGCLLSFGVPTICQACFDEIGLTDRTALSILL